MDNKAHYIIFHPDRARQKAVVSGVVLRNEEAIEGWQGYVWVDCIGRGNEDPFVFTDPWLYSYCHASQLRKSSGWPVYLKAESHLVFVSGDQANLNKLCIDTVFVIENVLNWNKPLGLPSKYQYTYKVENNPLWSRHFRFPFEGVHEKVSKTYEAAMWRDGHAKFAYLPVVAATGERVSIELDDLDVMLAKKIRRNIKGKYPVLLSGSDVEAILKEITKDSVLKVVEIKNCQPVQLGLASQLC